MDLDPTHIFGVNNTTNGTKLFLTSPNQVGGPSEVNEFHF